MLAGCAVVLYIYLQLKSVLFCLHYFAVIPTIHHFTISGALPLVQEAFET